MKNQTKILATLLTLSALSAPSMLLAQDDLLTESQTVLNAEQIDIDADYEEPEQPTAQEIIEQARQKSEIKNVKKIAKKIENLKVPTAQVKQITDQESASLANKISDIFGASQPATTVAPVQSQPVAPVQTQAVDTVTVQQAAPVVQNVIMAAPEIKKPVEMDSIRIIPNAGVINIRGNDISLESKYSVGLGVETMVHPHIAVGLAVGYSGLDLVDVNQAWEGSAIGNYSELEYKQLDVKINSKFFFIAEGKFRPYAGLGLGYSRVNMNYTGESNDYSNANWFYGNTAPKSNLPIDEEFSSGFASGNISLGTEFKFTKNIGVMVEGSYSRSFTGALAGKSVLKTEKQARLDVLGEEITKSDIIALNAGLLVTF